MQHETFDLLKTDAMDDWRAQENATRRIVALVRRSEHDLAIVADVAVVPLVSLLSYRTGLAAMWAADALYCIAHRGWDARTIQIAQANVTAPLVALNTFQITGGGLDSTNVDHHTFEMLGLLARHPSTVLLVVQAGATRQLVDALNVRENVLVFNGWRLHSPTSFDSMRRRSRACYRRGRCPPSSDAWSDRNSLPVVLYECWNDECARRDDVPHGRRASDCGNPDVRCHVASKNCAISGPPT